MLLRLLKNLHWKQHYFDSSELLASDKMITLSNLFVSSRNWYKFLKMCILSQKFVTHYQKNDMNKLIKKAYNLLKKAEQEKILNKQQWEAQ